MNLIHSIVLIVVMLSMAFGQGAIQAPPSYVGPYRPVFDEFPTGSPLTTLRPDKVDSLKPSFAKDTLIINFENRQVSYSRYDTLSGMPLWEFHYDELGDYLKAMEKHTRFALWETKMVEKGKRVRDKDSNLTFALPAHLPAWATRILGKEPPKLSITGSQKIKVGAKRTKQSIDGQVDEDNTSTQPLFTPTSNFVIKGSVGRLLKLEIRLQGETNNSDQLFGNVEDQLSNIKIEYREDSIGELEDDIIQEVVIGRTNFNMPGQGLAGYSSGSNDGLFGIKVRSQIGPVSLTSIASIEQVQNEEKEISLTASNNTITIGEKGYKRNSYFFLDEVYRLRYLASFTDSLLYNNYLSENGFGTQSPVIKNLQVFKKIGKQKPDDPGNEYVWARYNRDDSTSSLDVFQKLEDNRDYVYDPYRGRVVFKSSVSSNDLIAIYLQDTSGTFQKGSLKEIYDTTFEVNAYEDLWVLKKPDDETFPTDPLYNLMMRNVYDLSSTSATPEFKIKRRVTGSNDLEERNEAGKYYAQIMGIMDENENYRYQNEEIFDLSNNCIIFPPYTSTTGDTLYNDVTALHPFSNPALGETQGEQNWGHVIYNDRSSENWTERFSMETTSKEKQTSFNLDFGVMPETETIKAGETILERNVDYTIDYGMGYVSLISERAKSQDNLSATYQKESLFFLDNKVFLGFNGKVDLPNIGRKSYFGTTVMWQLMNSKSLTPKVGTEPFDRFLFDANLELDFEPDWMTALVNSLPLISTDAASTARFSFEMAYSKAQKSNKDIDEAYIDNFQTSSKVYSLGTNHRNWYQASPDASWSSSQFVYHPPAWMTYWIQPVTGDNRINKSDIRPLLKDNNGVEEKDEKIATLRLVVQPFPEDSTLRSGVMEVDGSDTSSTVAPWGGIMRGLSGSLMDHKDDRYFEFWVRHNKWRNGGELNQGELIVDLGLISENISLDGQAPNQLSDYEFVGSGFTNEDDIGIDRLTDDKEIYFYPDFTSGSPEWTELVQGDPALGIYVGDPARDNYQYYGKDSKQNAPYATGTQKNKTVNPNPDSKDVDKNGSVYHGTGAYFRYRINLANVEYSPYVSTTEKANNENEGWVKIRIPIGDNATEDMIDSVVNDPTWDKISHVRFLYHDMDPSVITEPGYRDTLEFEGIQFVGNLWRELVTDSFNVGNVTATIEDSKSSTAYRRPPEKRVEVINGSSLATDYTLILDFDAVYSDSTVLAYRNFSGFQSMDFTNYKEIRFWAEELDRQISTSRGNKLVFRFGSNDSTYYEYKTNRLIDDTGSVAINHGWNSDHGIQIDLNRFTDLKYEWFNVNGERMDSVRTSMNDLDSNTYTIYSATQQMPTLSSVQWMAFGVENESGTDFIGRVRINGLRVAGMNDREGWALRSSMNLEFADFVKGGATYNYTDADFRSMAQDVHTAGNTSMKSGINGEMQLAKFIPNRLGIQLPVGGQVNGSLTRPDRRTNSDISLRDENGDPDGMSDMARDFARVFSGKEDRTADTEAEKYQKMGKEYRVYTSYHKNNESKNKIVNLTADRIGVNYSYSVTDSTSRNGEIPESEVDLVRGTDGAFHIDQIQTKGHTFALDYDLSPTSNAKKKTSWQPFQKSKNRKMPRKIKSMKLNLLPSKIDFDLIDMNYRWEERYNSLYEVRDSTYQFIPKENLGIKHGFDFRYEPISPFTSMNLTVKSQRDFESYLKTWNDAGMIDFIDKGLFRLNPYWADYYFLKMENNRNHNTQFKLSPEILSIMPVTTTLSSNYTQNVNILSDTSLLNGTLTSKFDVNTQFRVRRVFDDMGKWGEGGFAKTMKAISEGMNKVDLERITFDYGASMNLGTSYMDSLYLNRRLDKSPGAYYAYTLGLYDRSLSEIMRGDMNDRDAFAGVQNRTDSTNWNWNGNIRNISDQRKTSQNFGGRTSIKLPNPVDVTFNQLSLRWKRDYTKFTRYGKMDTVVTWPDILVQATSPILRKIPQVQTNFRSLNLKTGYTYNKKTQRTSEYFVQRDSTAQEVTHKDTYTWGLDPLFKIDGVLKKRAIDVGYSFGMTWDTTYTQKEGWDFNTSSWAENPFYGSKTFTTKQTWSAGYKIPAKKGRTIKLFRSRVIELTGETRFDLIANLRKLRHDKIDYIQKNEFGEIEDEDPWEEIFFDLKPKVEYDFTKNIHFQIYYILVNKLEGIEQKRSHDGEIAGEVEINF